MNRFSKCVDGCGFADIETLAFVALFSVFSVIKEIRTPVAEFF